MELEKIPIYRFIKKYPHVSCSIGIIILIFILILPIPLKDKIMLPLRALVLGFIVALIWYYFKFYRVQHK